MDEVSLLPFSFGESPTALWQKKCQGEAQVIAKSLLKAHSKSSELNEQSALQTCRDRLVGEYATQSSTFAKAAVALTHLYADLLEQGWSISVRKNNVIGTPANAVGGSDTRLLKRRKFTVRRDEQLRDNSTREFIDRMERGVLVNQTRKSIFSLMRDGRELAKKLEDVKSPDDLGAILQPYVEFVSAGARCKHTGLYLQDIWRYFRHGWSNPYESIPGRGLLGLVRDAAAKDHPIVGIFAVSSAAIGMETRDRFIGWDADQVLANMAEDDSNRFANWIPRVIEKILDGIYLTDFVRDKILPPHLPDVVAESVLVRLAAVEAKARETHHRLASASENKRLSNTLESDDDDWETQAKTPLYRAKRARELIRIIEIKNALSKFTHKSRFDITSALKDSTARGALKKLLKTAKSISVGTEIAELTVCGAVAPYGPLLGGKLVAAMAISPAVSAEYERRYSKSPSVIASSMAGHRVIRPNKLVFVGTTSLYGVRPNQYDRISIPLSDKLTDSRALRFKFLGYTEEGVGTFQFGRETKAAIEDVGRALSNGWRVNNVFGEGTSPKLRSLRDGLRSLGMKADPLLRHQLHKAVYGAPLIENLRDYLLGLDKEAAFLAPLESAEYFGRKIAEWWLIRWCFARVSRSDVLDEIRTHTLIHPVKHGARVQRFLPDTDQYSMRLD